jgi:transcription initiation factor IIE alpha subunit
MEIVYQKGSGKDKRISCRRRLRLEEVRRLMRQKVGEPGFPSLSRIDGDENAFGDHEERAYWAVPWRSNDKIKREKRADYGQPE